MTTQSVNDHWVEITKAFKTLTDEDIRNNYIQFGHPDGKQSFSIGIALPKFIVTEGNGKYVLLVYAALIGVLLPYLVGTWWYGTQKLTKDGILISSAGKLFTEYREDMVEGAVVGALSNGDEYENALKGKAHQSSSKIETRILESNDAKGTLGIKGADSEKLLSLENEQRRKILGLLWAYLNRTSLDDASLDEGVFPNPTILARSVLTTDGREVRSCTYSFQPQRIFHQHDTCIRKHTSPSRRLSHFARFGPGHASAYISSAAITALHPADCPGNQRKSCGRNAECSIVHGII